MSKRIVGYDVARSLAIFGMVMVNFRLVLGSPEGWYVGMFKIIEGKAAATFVVLAGVGLSLLSNGKDATRSKKLIRRRAIFLFVFGLLYAPLWPPDILHFYGVYLMIGALAITWSDKVVWMLYVLFIFGFNILVVLINYETGWDFDSLEYVDFWTAEGMLRHLFYNGFHPIFPWVSFLMAGIWLGRQDLANHHVRYKVLRNGIALILFSSVVSYFGVSLGGDFIYVFGLSMIPPFPLFVLLGTGVSFVVIVSSIALAERISLTWLVETGQLAMTNYVLHVVVGLIPLLVMGVEETSLNFILFYSIFFFGFMVMFSHYWRQRYSRGPLELFMRRMTG